MKGKGVRITVICLIAVAAMLVAAGSAAASVHVTDRSVSSGTLSDLSVESTGDAAQAHGNQNDLTSPILPDTVDLDNFYWFNQDVRVTDLGELADPDGDSDVSDPTGGFWQLSTNGTTYGAMNVFAPDALPILSAEGLYSVSATGTDEDQTSPVTGTVEPAFGIDKTKPVSMTDLPAVPSWDPDAVPVFNGMAVVTISATDTLSGVENLQYSMDGGPFDWANDADPGSDFTVPVTFATPGVHTLSWHVFDNAGNIDSHSVMFIVRPVPFTPNVNLRLFQSGTGKRRVNFQTEIDPLATNSTVVLTIQRKSGRIFKSFMTVNLFQAKFTDDNSVTLILTRHRTFRVKATCNGGTTTWKTFSTH